jgi:hypothetical protein
LYRQVAAAPAARKFQVRGGSIVGYSGAHQNVPRPTRFDTVDPRRIVQRRKQKAAFMADFVELKVWGGVGDWHLNRYRIAFECPAGITKETLAADLIDRFPTYLESDFATVEKGGRQFEGKDTLKFTGAMKIGPVDANFGVHHDWVVLAWTDRSIGFTGQTLKRNFLELGDALTGAGGSAVGRQAGAKFAINENKMHFLAGRRSWRIDTLAAFHVDPKEYNSPPDSGNLLILETAAVERLSDRVYMAADTVAGLEQRIPPIWISNLENFVSKNKRLGLKPRTRLWGYGRSGWDSSASQFPAVGSGYVSFYRENFRDFNAMASDYEYLDVNRLFPSLTPPR